MNEFLSRKDTAIYLTNAGISISKTTLARMAMNGEGPKYIILRQKAYYKPEWLDEWLSKFQPSPSAIEHMARMGGENV